MAKKLVHTVACTLAEAANKTVCVTLCYVQSEQLVNTVADPLEETEAKTLSHTRRNMKSVTLTDMLAHNAA